MDKVRNYFKREKPAKGFLFSFLIFLGLILLAPSLSSAGSIREVAQSIERVQSIEQPFRFAVIGDSRDGEKVYIQLMQRILERKPHFIIHLGDMISEPHLKEWQAFFAISKPVDAPFFPVAGNHDVGFTLRGEEMYRRHFTLPGGKTY